MAAVRAAPIEIELAAPAEVVAEIRHSLPKLEEHLAKKWPVTEVRFAYRNPYLTPVLTSMS